MNLISKDSLKRAVRTFVPAFLVLFVPGLLGWLNDVTSWAQSNGATAFPDAHGLAYLAVSATVAGLIALGQLVMNAIEDHLGRGFLRDPSVPDDEADVYLIDQDAIDHP